MFILNINPVDKTIVLFYWSLFLYLSSKKKNLLLLYSHVTYLYLINYTYSP